jgi:hypothetical protein
MEEWEVDAFVQSNMVVEKGAPDVCGHIQEPVLWKK